MMISVINVRATYKGTSMSKKNRIERYVYFGAMIAETMHNFFII